MAMSQQRLILWAGATVALGLAALLFSAAGSVLGPVCLGLVLLPLAGAMAEGGR